MRKAIVAVLLLMVVGCSSTATDESTTTTVARPTATTLSERETHWRDVVADMDCAELADLRRRRQAVDFNDQAESLKAILQRQYDLAC